MFILEEENPDLYDRVQEQNLNRQYELLTNCIEIGLMKGPGSFDKYLLWALNHVAVANISQFGGRFRREPIYVGDHKPPHFNDVDDWMDRGSSRRSKRTGMSGRQRNSPLTGFGG
jgi:hypothetical protein